MNHAHKRILIAIAAVSLLGAACAKKNVALPAAPAGPGRHARGRFEPAPAPPARVATAERPAPVTAAPRYPNAATRARIDELLARIEDAYFDYNQATCAPMP